MFEAVARQGAVRERHLHRVYGHVQQGCALLEGVLHGLDGPGPPFVVRGVLILERGTARERRAESRLPGRNLVVGAGELLRPGGQEVGLAMEPRPPADRVAVLDRGGGREDLPVGHADDLPDSQHPGEDEVHVHVLEARAHRLALHDHIRRVHRSSSSWSGRPSATLVVPIRS